jgi:RND family efflux transporter MFP subunit
MSNSRTNFPLAAVIAVVFSILLPLGALSAAEEGKGGDKPAAEAGRQEAPKGPPPTIVRLGLVGTRSVAQTTPFVGMVDFEDVAQIGPEVSGKVDKFLAREGATVKRGDALLTLDTELRAMDSKVAMKDAEEAKLKYHKLEADLVRAESLFNKGIISREDFDNTKSLRDEQEKKFESMTAKYGKLQLEIEKATVRAPFDGIVLEKHASAGDWLGVGDKAVTLASTGDVYVLVAVPEDIVRFVGVGQKVGLTINALGKDIAGTVSGVIPVAEPRTRNFKIKVKIPYTSGMLLNMSANVHVPTSPPMELKVISRDALVNFNGSDFVFTVKDGKGMILPATIAAYLGGEVGVTDPYFFPGMPVVVEGNDRLMPDAPVIIKNPEIIPQMPAVAPTGGPGGAPGKPEGGK